MKDKRYKAWTDADKNFIRVNYGKMSKTALSKILHCNISAVYTMASKLGVANNEWSNGSLCWDCQNATGNCSWSRCFKPVKGWDAEPTVVNDIVGSKYPPTKSYNVRECPQFLRDGEKPNKIVSDENGGFQMSPEIQKAMARLGYSVKLVKI